MFAENRRARLVGLSIERDETPPGGPLGQPRDSNQDGPLDTLEASPETGGEADPTAFSHEPHRDLIADFIDALDEGREPRVSGAEALAVHRLIDALLRSSRERRPIAIG